MSTLLLRLAAPTQGWWVRRSTVTDFSRPAMATTGPRHPTRSGVVGLLAAAMGRPRGADMSDLEALRMLCRDDAPGRFRSEFRVTRRRTTSGSVIPRPVVEGVLDDAAFLVAIEGDQNLIERIAAALQRPVYPLYLGRREYPPTPPLLLGVVDVDARTAIAERPWLGGRHHDPTHRPWVVDLRAVALDPGADLDGEVVDWLPAL